MACSSKSESSHSQMAVKVFILPNTLSKAYLKDLKSATARNKLIHLVDDFK